MPMREQNQDRGGQRDAERSLQGARALGGPFVAAVEATRMPMVVTDPTVDGNPIVYANQSFLEMCGYAMEEVLGQSYLFLAGHETDEGTAGRILAAMEARERLVEDVRVYRKDGTPIWVSMFVSPVVVDGAVVQHFASLLDVKRRVDAEEEVRRINADLERRVQERTQALEATNRRLEEEIERRAALEVMLRDALAKQEDSARYIAFLAKEIEHRTRNTLQFASSILVFQAGPGADGATRSALRTAQDRLVRMAQMQGHIYRGDQAGSVDFGSYVGERAREILASTHAAPGQIDLSVEGAPLVLGPDLVLPLGLIVGEAITNAVKHAFPEGARGRIEVGLTPVDTGTMCLSIADDGVGVSGPRRPGSMGADLIGGLAAKARGRVTIEPRAGGGTRVAVTFPVPAGPDPRRTAG